MSEEKILERVRKMLALANDEAATEGERDNALRMAHNLLMKHQLSIEDVEKHERDKSDPRGHFEQDGWSMPWAKQVRMAVAKLFFCIYYTGRKVNATKTRNHFIGREGNATTAMFMSEYLINSILKECRNRYVHNLAPESRAFATGAASRLWARVRELRDQKQQEIKETGSALVLLDLEKREEEENEDFLCGLGIRLKEHKQRAMSVSTAGFNEGYAFGGKLSLNTQIKDASGGSRLQLGRK